MGLGEGRRRGPVTVAVVVSPDGPQDGDGRPPRRRAHPRAAGQRPTVPPCPSPHETPVPDVQRPSQVVAAGKVPPVAPVVQFSLPLVVVVPVATLVAPVASVDLTLPQVGVRVPGPEEAWTLGRQSVASDAGVEGPPTRPGSVVAPVATEVVQTPVAAHVDAVGSAALGVLVRGLSEETVTENLVEADTDRNRVGTTKKGATPGPLVSAYLRKNHVHTDVLGLSTRTEPHN